MTQPAPPPTSVTAGDPRAIFDAVRADGGRLTIGRRAVIAALCAEDRWLTVPDLVELVRPQWSRVNEATVYRLLELLERLGMVTHTHLGHGPSYWHAAGSDAQPLFCEGCGTVRSVPRAWIDPVVRRVAAETGFVVAMDHFAWSGFCRECAGLSAS